MNQRDALLSLAFRRVYFSLLFLGSFVGSPSFGQSCPQGRIDVAELTARMEHTNDPNVIFRSSAIAESAILPVLFRLSKPGMSAETVAGAAQVSLAKLGDENAITELNNELNAGTTFNPPSQAIGKLLLVGNRRAVAILMTYLAAHPEPVMVGFEIDSPYDLRMLLIIGLADIVENAPIQTDGKHRGAIEDWIDWWTRGKENPIPLSVSTAFQHPYLQCLGRKVEWGFPMAMVDLGGTGDPRVVPVVQKLAGMGYPYQGYAGSRSPYIWLRHDCAETALAKWGDAEAFDIIEHELSTNAYETAILKLQIIGGRKAMAALMELKFFNPAYVASQPLMHALAQMVQDPPLQADAGPTVENVRKWKEWWSKNKDAAKFVSHPTFE